MRSALQREVTLVVPSKISYAGSLGRSISFAQLIATWAKSSSERCARTRLRADGHDLHQSFVSRFHGLAAAYYANRITASDEKTDIRQELLKAAAPRIRAMSARRYGEVARGSTVEIVFVNHARHEFHPVAYVRTPTHAEIMESGLHGELIVSPREMNAFLIKTMQALNFIKADVERMSPLVEQADGDGPLGRLLHETFRNTADHAYLDGDRRIPRQGLRCILVAFHHSEEAELQPNALVSAEHPQLEEYFSDLRARTSEDGRKRVFILELSIFDSGPGFADTANLPSATDDLARVTHCFQKYASSKPSANSGLGLGRVLAIVHQLNGFVRFRTSSTEAFFSSSSPASPDSRPAPNIVGSLPKVTGTALTIGVPLAMRPR